MKSFGVSKNNKETYKRKIGRKKKKKNTLNTQDSIRCKQEIFLNFWILQLKHKDERNNKEKSKRTTNRKQKNDER